MLWRTGFWIGIYPLVAHFGLWTSQPRLVVGYLLALVLFTLLSPPGFYQLKNIVFASVIVLTTISLAVFDLDRNLIYFPPVLIPTVLFIVFTQSLAVGQTPLITKFAIKSEGKLSVEKEHYTRQVTLLWACIFFFMVIEAISLAIVTSLNTWSWFTHIGNYILIAVVLILEFSYRRYRFKSNKSFMQFIMALIKYRWK